MANTKRLIEYAIDCMNRATDLADKSHDELKEVYEFINEYSNDYAVKVGGMKAWCELAHAALMEALHEGV